MKVPDTAEAYTLFNGSLKLCQPRSGPRTSVDAILLADFLSTRYEPIAELGLGNGVASLAALYLGRAPASWGIEIQKDLAELAELNAEAGGYYLEICHGDLRLTDDLGGSSRFTRVIANPPFRGPSDGRRSPDQGRDASRREVHANLGDFLDAARWLLTSGGRFTLIYTARRLAELITELRARRLEPKRLLLIHPSMDRPARLAIIESVLDGGVELNILEPLFTHYANGFYTRSMGKILAGRPSPG